MKKLYSPTWEELEAKRIKKNEALKEWRHEHKEKVAKYMKDWYAERKKIEDAVKLAHEKSVKK